MLEIELFKAFSIFTDFPEEHLAEMAQWGKVLEFDLNETIFQDGENAFNLYGVVDGKVELSLMVRDELLKTDIQYEESIQTHIETVKKDIIVDSIEPGEIFGWSALIEPRRFTTTAKCSKTTKIVSLPADQLKAIFDKNPQIGYVFMERLAEIVSQRLRNRTDKLMESWSQAFDVSKV